MCFILKHLWIYKIFDNIFPSNEKQYFYNIFNYYFETFNNIFLRGIPIEANYRGTFSSSDKSVRTFN